MRAAPLALRDGDRERLESWLRSSTIQAGLAQRARIVLLAADGLPNVEIADPGRGVAADGDQLARPVCAQRDRRAVGRGPVRPASHDRPQQDRGDRR